MPTIVRRGGPSSNSCTTAKAELRSRRSSPAASEAGTTLCAHGCVKSAEAIDERASMKRPYDAQHIPALRLCSAFYSLRHQFTKNRPPLQAQGVSTLRLRGYTSVYHNSLRRLWPPEVRWANALGPRWDMSGHAIRRTSAPISTHKEKCLRAKSDKPRA